MQIKNALFIDIFICFVFILIISYNQCNASSLINLFKTEDKKGKTYRFEDKNFLLNNISKDYIHLKKQEETITLQLMNGRLGVYFITIAEKLGEEYGIDIDSLVEISQANLKSVSAQCTISETKDYSNKDVEGKIYYSEVELNGINLSYTHWLYVNNGYAYQLITYSQERNKAIARKEAWNFIDSFEQIDPNNIIRYQNNEKKMFGRYISDFSGLQIDLSKANWYAYSDSHIDQPESEIGGVSQNGGGFIVSPFYLSDTQESMDVLVRALLVFWSLSYPNDIIYDYKSYAEESQEIVEFKFNRIINQVRYYYIARIVKKNDVIFLLMFWNEKSMEILQKEYDEVISKVIINSPLVKDINYIPTRIIKETGRYYNQIGLYYFENYKMKEALRYFKKSISFDSGNSSYLSNTLNAFSNMDMYREAIEYYDSLDSVVKDEQNVLSWIAWLLMLEDKKERSMSAYQKLFRGDYSNDNDFNHYINVLIENKKWEEIESALMKYQKISNSSMSIVKRADYLRAQNKLDEAVKILESEKDKYPTNVLVLKNLMKLYEEVGQYENVIVVSIELIGLRQSLYDSYLYKGKSEYYLKKYKEAKLSFEAALKQNPGDQTAKNFLRNAAGMLGQGENHLLKKEITKVKLPRLISHKIENSFYPQSNNHDGYYNKYWVKCHELVDPHNYKSTIYMSYEVLNSNGIQHLSSLVYDFNPLSEKVYINSVLIKNENDEIIYTGQIEDYYYNDKVSNMATYDKTITIPLKKLQVGFEVEVVITYLQDIKFNEIPYESFTFGTTVPSGFIAMSIDVDKDKLSYLSIGDINFMQKNNTHMWYITDYEGTPWEPMQAPRYKFRPSIIFAASGLDWKQVGDEILGRMIDKVKVTPIVREKTLEITKLFDSKEEKVEAVAQFIRSNFVYKAIEFGVRGQIPQLAEETLQIRYGDCKDLSTLMKSMLDVIDVKSYYVLCNTNKPVIEGIPTDDQFNHVVLFIEDYKNGIYYDPTNLSASLNVKSPINLGGEKVLVLYEESNSKIKTVPQYVPDENKINIKRTIAIEGNKLNVNEEIMLSGYYASFARNYLKPMDKKSRQDWVYNTLAEQSTALIIDSFELKNLNKETIPLVINVCYSVYHSIFEDEEGYNFNLPAGFEISYLKPRFVANRFTPFYVEYPIYWTTELVLKIPDSKSKVSYKYPKIAKKSNLIHSELKTSVGQKEYNIKFEYRTENGLYPVGEYHSYCDSVVESIRSISGRIDIID